MYVGRGGTIGTDGECLDTSPQEAVLNSEVMKKSRRDRDCPVHTSLRYNGSSKRTIGKLPNTTAECS
jgi:hypothetical protein